MLGQIDARIVIGAMSTSFAAILGVVYWTARTKVNHKLCDTVQQQNREDHEHIRQWVKDAEGRAEGRHKELKTDLKEVKELIRNNGNTRGRVFT